MIDASPARQARGSLLDSGAGRTGLSADQFAPQEISDQCDRLRRLLLHQPVLRVRDYAFFHIGSSEAHICHHGWTVGLFDLRSRANIQWLSRTRSDLP
jgi:hypothetical protein